ncbi:MAG: hypothetical protein V7723_13945 [Sneathiella sp.]|uniref:hypothetical protein n=1 Tax=Sneathiella sp. TaxID=1964365 RepID=UPI00300280A3
MRWRERTESPIGEFAGANNVWGQITVLRHASIECHFMVALRAFMDKSADDHICVLGGAVANVASCAAFSAEWEEILPLGPIRKDGKHHFKFSSMAGRIDGMPAFWHVGKTSG